MIDKVTEDLRQIYETTENEFNLKVQKGIKNNWTKTKLKKELIKANKRSLRYVKRVAPYLLVETEKINERLFKSALKQFSIGVLKVARLKRTIPLKESIERVTKEGIDKGLKIRAGNRTWSYKTYMEMNARTTVQHELVDNLLKSGGENDVVFYLCNVFADCADDHKDFQGKMYYDDRWRGFKLKNKKEISKFIKSKKMLSVQRVRDKKPYLTTRPNCRHTFTPISIKQALGESEKTLVTKLKLKTGSYKPKNYENLQQQRYNERMIRKYKERSAMYEELGYDNTKEKKLISKWQAEQRKLVKSDSNLQRDYRRESNKILINDLGVRYNT